MKIQCFIANLGKLNGQIIGGSRYFKKENENPVILQVTISKYFAKPKNPGK